MKDLLIRSLFILALMAGSPASGSATVRAFENAGAMSSCVPLRVLRPRIRRVDRLSAALAQAPGIEGAKPLTKQQLLDLIQGGVPSQRAIELIRSRGIDFQADEDYLRSLRRAGGTDQLVSELRKFSVPMEGITVETDPSAEIFIDGISQGLADSRGVLVFRAKVGPHALRISQPGKRNFDQKFTLIDEQPLHIVAQLVAINGGLRIKAPAGASIWLDNNSRGSVDNAGEIHFSDLSPGVHTLRIALKGKADDSRDVVVTAGSEVALEANLLDTLQVNPQDGLNYVWIAPGTFAMGCSVGDGDCSEPEKPSHQVTIRKGFWIGQMEVPVGAYRNFARETKTKMPPSAPKSFRNWGVRNLPIVDETWDEANQYCTWAEARLPTEAEWEYAARGGSPRARYGHLDEIAWSKENAQSQTHLVGGKRANGYGLLDVIGNVWEWVNDWYDPTYYKNGPAQDPSGPATGQQKVLRGGSWIVDSKLLRVSNRYAIQSDARSDFFGFRCVWIPKAL